MPGTIFFEGDPSLGPSLREIEEDGAAIRPLSTTPEGIRALRHNLVLTPTEAKGP